MILEDKEKDSRSVSQCSVDENSTELASFADNNSGFDIEEEIESSKQNGLGHSPTATTVKSCSQRETQTGIGSTHLETGKILSDKKNLKFLPNHKRKSLEGDYVKMKKPNNPREKIVLKDVSAYFNPGEMVAISGSGKTTLLD